MDFPLKFVGDEHNAANVVIEMSGTLSWRGKGGWVEGVTFRRPKLSSGESSAQDMLRVSSSGRIDMVHSVIDNGGSAGAAVALEGARSGGRWLDVTVCGGNKGIHLDNGAVLELKEVRKTVFLRRRRQIVAL